MELTSISLSEGANSVHVTVTDQNGVDANSVPVDNLLALANVSWSTDPAVMVTPDATGFLFSYNKPFTPGTQALGRTAVASYIGANAVGGQVFGPTLIVNVVFPPAPPPPPPQVTALRYFS